MNLLTHRPRSPEGTALRERIFRVLPAASYQMEKLFGLFDIEFSTETATACVECRATPRLLLNRQFVEEHCQADSDLFLLILHELHHVILGHTRLFPRATPIDNLVFDAVINAMLARTVGRTVGTGLLTRFYDFRQFPQRLLRPPPGWPGDFAAGLRDLPESEARAIRLLYGPDGTLVTYHDIYELLRRSLRGTTLLPCVLLGNHGPDDSHDSLLDQAVRRIVEGWPPPPFRISGRDAGVQAKDQYFPTPQRPGLDFEREFRRLLRRCRLTGTRASSHYRLQKNCEPEAVDSVLPDHRDRRVASFMRVYGHSPVLFRSAAPVTRMRRRPAAIVHAYLDVSGSMRAHLPYLTAACRAPLARGELRLFVFSTEVDEVSERDLERARFRSTDGTDINAVLQHVVRLPRHRRPRVVLLVTDGYVGTARPDLLSRLGRIRTVAALTSPPHVDDLQPWVSTLAPLPPL